RLESALQHVDAALEAAIMLPPRDLGLPSFVCIDAPPPEPYTLSLHDALPISGERTQHGVAPDRGQSFANLRADARGAQIREGLRSEEHTSELQSPCNLVCRLLLEKKKMNDTACDTVPQPSSWCLLGASITPGL